MKGKYLFPIPKGAKEEMKGFITWRNRKNKITVCVIHHTALDVGFPYNLYNKILGLICKRCNGNFKLSFIEKSIKKNGRNLIIENYPFFFCSKCGEKVLFPKSYILKKMKVIKKNNVSFIIEPPKKKFDLCQHFGFEYDPLDYYLIPGLFRPRDDGFLTPVFFRREVLINYSNEPDYFIEYSSDTYGNIYKQNAHLISFGINANDEVIMWLGDISALPVKEKHYLMVFNIHSSHDIGSEFYLGQIEVVFTEISKEKKLLDARSIFNRFVIEKFGIQINHLEPEATKSLRIISSKPVNWHDNNLKQPIEALNKVCIETINNKKLKLELKNISKKDKKELGGMKLLELWLQSKIGVSNAPHILTPLFVLYDFNVVLKHLMSSDDTQEKLTTCYDRLNILNAKRNYKSLYCAIIDGLLNMYNELTNILNQKLIS